VLEWAVSDGTGTGIAWTLVMFSLAAAVAAIRRPPAASEVVPSADDDEVEEYDEKDER
jgi:hypothetical protein